MKTTGIIGFLNWPLHINSDALFWMGVCVTLNVYVMVFFRVYGKKYSDIFPVLVWNYFFATLLGGALYYNQEQSFKNYFPLFRNAICMGGLFLGVFYVIAQTTNFFGVGTASLANKSGFIFPALLAWLAFDENPGVYRIFVMLAGLLFLVLALYEKNVPVAGIKKFLPIILLAGSGTIDMLMLWNSRTYFKTTSDSGWFSTMIFLSAFGAGSVILLLKKKAKAFINLRVTASGLLLGIPNFFSIVSLLKALETMQGESAVVFGWVNIGIVFFSVGAGMVLFSEKKNIRQWIGVVGLVGCLLLLLIV